MERDPNKSMIGSQFDTGSTVSGGTSEAVPSYAPIHSKKMAVKTITELCELSDFLFRVFQSQSGGRIRECPITNSWKNFAEIIAINSFY